MKTTKLKVKNLNLNYSIIIGRNILNKISIKKIFKKIYSLYI
jgi:hypothetical protein